MSKSLSNEFFQEISNYNTDNWREQAACSSMDTEIFFNDTGDGRQDKSRLKLALDACNTCPVISECLSFAKGNHLRHGIYGGSRYIKNSRRWANLLEEKD